MGKESNYQKEVFLNWCKNNNSLVLLIDRLKIVGLHNSVEGLVPITYLQNTITD